MFHHRFVKQQEALGFSLFLLSIGLWEAFLRLFFCCFTVLQRLFLCLFLCRFIVLQRLFLCFFFIASPRSSEVFFSSFFVYFVYERLVVVGQQGEPIVTACQKNHMGGAQE